MPNSHPATLLVLVVLVGCTDTVDEGPLSPEVFANVGHNAAGGTDGEHRIAINRPKVKSQRKPRQAHSRLRRKNSYTDAEAKAIREWLRGSPKVYSEFIAEPLHVLLSACTLELLRDEPRAAEFTEFYLNVTGEKSAPESWKKLTKLQQRFLLDVRTKQDSVVRLMRARLCLKCGIPYTGEIRTGRSLNLSSADLYQFADINNDSDFVFEEIARMRLIPKLFVPHDFSKALADRLSAREWFADHPLAIDLSTLFQAHLYLATGCAKSATGVLQPALKRLLDGKLQNITPAYLAIGAMMQGEWQWAMSAERAVLMNDLVSWNHQHKRLHDRVDMKTRWKWQRPFHHTLVAIASRCAWLRVYGDRKSPQFTRDNAFPLQQELDGYAALMRKPAAQKDKIRNARLAVYFFDKARRGLVTRNTNEYRRLTYALAVARYRLAIAKGPLARGFGDVPKPKKPAQVSYGGDPLSIYLTSLLEPRLKAASKKPPRQKLVAFCDGMEGDWRVSEVKSIRTIRELVKSGRPWKNYWVLAEQPDLNAPVDDVGNTPLHLACVQNHPPMVYMLGYHQVDVNRRNRRGETPLHTACRKGSIDCVLALLRLGADEHALTANGEHAHDLMPKKVRRILHSLAKAQSGSVNRATLIRDAVRWRCQEFFRAGCNDLANWRNTKIDRFYTKLQRENRSRQTIYDLAGLKEPESNTYANGSPTKRVGVRATGTRVPLIIRANRLPSSKGASKLTEKQLVALLNRGWQRRFTAYYLADFLILDPRHQKYGIDITSKNSASYVDDPDGFWKKVYPKSKGYKHPEPRPYYGAYDLYRSLDLGRCRGWYASYAPLSKRLTRPKDVTE